MDRNLIYVETVEQPYAYYEPSREPKDHRETDLGKDVAFNRHSKNQDGTHNSPSNNARISVGVDDIKVRLVQGIDEEKFRLVNSKALRATTGLQVGEDEMADWDEMLRGGLQASLETQVVVFEISGVSRCCTHQLVRTRKAGFHQQSQRATWYGTQPDVRMPESIWRDPRARDAYLKALAAAHEAYRVACEQDISYQDARYILPEGTTNYILCEYPLREFIATYAYRACTMFQHEIVQCFREMGRLLVEAHPWLEPYIKISCQKSGMCEFQGWEQVEGQCTLPYAVEENRRFKPKKELKIV
jgi:flavin-dependent thymidylate synthase